VRDNIEVASGISEEDAKEKAMASEQVKKWTEGKKIVKIIFVKNRLINIVIKN
jgi:leucyl-tRNA synthetase